MAGRAGNLGVAAVARAIAAGTLTSEAAVAACLARIAEREDTVGAWEHLDPEGALAQARALDRMPAQGPLHGVPLGVKDIIDTAEMPTGYGSPIYAGHRPAWDAACVAMARRAGAVVLGKTVSTEFAYFRPGRTANPLDPARTPGGSSSGSAAAVADGMVPAAFATQTAGSITRPAAFCGVVGYKPSFATIPRGGVRPFSDTLDTVGVIARSVEDAALVASAAAGRPDLAALPDLGRPPRIGLCRTAEWPAAEPATIAIFEETAARLGATGAREVVLPPDFAGLADAQLAIMAAEAARQFAHERRVCPDRLSPRLADVLKEGDAIPAARVAEARALAERCRRQLPEAMGDLDILLVPSTRGEAPVGLGATGDPVFCRAWTLLHVPTVHLPLGHGSAGMPVGLQAVGRFGDDARVLAAAAWLLERAPALR